MKIFPNTMTGVGIKNFLLTLCLSVAVPGFAVAADFDGSRDLLCVPTDAIQCEGAGECVRVEVESLNLSKFVNIDFETKMLKGIRELGADEETTAIERVQKLEGQMVIQGAENGRGWSIVIDGQTGDMSVAIAGDDLVFVLFGVCQAN